MSDPATTLKLLGVKGNHWTAGSIGQSLPVLHQDMTCSEVFDWFDKNPQPAAAIVDEQGRVAGISNRLRFLARYARRYTPEIFGKRNILALANPFPMIVDEEMMVTDLSAKIVLDWPDALRECFVVTRGGRYYGIGTCEALVRCKLDLAMAQETRLEAALATAREANRTKSNFLAMMGHELRTPLNAIIGFSDILARELFGNIGQPKYRTYAEDIHGAGRHLLDLINDLLDLSKAEAGKLEISSEPIMISGLFEECLRLVLVAVQTKDISLITDVPADLPLFLADRLRIKQILVNLLSNATKFTPRGGTVELSAKLRSDDGFEFQVRDTGIGMAPEMIPLALEPFRQIHEPQSGIAQEGTGLGLPLTKSLTEQHGGKMMIESALCKGTIVRLCFPSSRTLRGQASIPKPVLSSGTLCDVA